MVGLDIQNSNPVAAFEQALGQIISDSLISAYDKNISHDYPSQKPKLDAI